MFSWLCFVALLLVAFHDVSCIKYTTCSSPSGIVTNVTVSGCGDSDECDLKKGKNTTITISFNLTKDTETVKGSIHGIIAHVPLPFPLPNPNGCKNSGLSCPLKSGQSYTYSQQLEVKRSYPAVKVLVKYELKDDAQQDIACVMISSRIIS